MAADIAPYEAIEAAFLAAVELVEQRIMVGLRDSAELDRAAWGERGPLAFEAEVVLPDPVVRTLALRILHRQGLRPGRSSRQRGVAFALDVPDLVLRAVILPELKRLEIAHATYATAVQQRLAALAFRQEVPPAI